jgi:hypothetical protein
MKLRKLSQSLFIIFAIGVLSIVSVIQAQKASSNNKKADPNIVVLVKGEIEPIEEPRQPDANCVKVDMYNAVTNKNIGYAVDCLVLLGATESGGLYFDRTTYFQFPQGELVASGITTVQPILAGSPGNTHIIGDIPEEGANNILSGTNRFAGATGRVRLSGAANLATTPEFFNCIFIIDLD